MPYKDKAMQKQHNKTYRIAHKDTLLEYNRNYYNVHKKELNDGRKEYRKEYYLSHKKHMDDLNEQYRQTHPEESRKYGAKYYQTHKEQECIRGKKYRGSHKEQLELKRKEWCNIHKNEIKEYDRKRNEERRVESKAYRQKNAQIIHERYLKNYPKNKEKYAERSYMRKRELGYCPLNTSLEGTQAHHIDTVNVIHIPKDIHRSIYHKLSNPKSMEKINLKAWDYLETSVL